MKHFLPTKDECDLICGNKAFFVKKFNVEGQEVVVYNYFLAQFKDFVKPLDNHPEISAQELRGLTFVKENGNWKRYLMLSKFFNLNQVPESMESEIRNQKIIRAQNKQDGSMIRFVPFANGKIRAKSKLGFDNEQSRMAQEYFDSNSQLREFVKETLEKRVAAIFELVSGYNKIVLDYNKTELILLQMRDEDTGEYLDIYNNSLVQDHKVKCTEKEAVKPLDWYIEQAKVLENKEGWVIQTDSILFKIKTQWYFDLHGILTDSLTREDQIISLILNEKLDDAFQHLVETDPRRIFAEAVQKALTLYISNLKLEILNLASLYTGDRKKFALDNIKNPLFHYAAKIIGISEQIDEKMYMQIKKNLLRKTLFEAKDFLKTLGLVAPKGSFFVDDDN